MANLTNSVREYNFTTAVGGTIANSGDSIVLNQYSDTYSAGLGLSGKTLDRLDMQPEWSGDIDPTPLVINATLAYVRWSGRLLRLGGSSVTWTTTIIDAARGGMIMAASMTFGTLWLMNGTVDAADSCVVTTGWVGGSGRMTLAKGGTAPTTLNVLDGGQVDLYRACGTANVYGGTLNVRDLTSTFTALNQFNGTVKITLGGTITAYAGYGGVLDLRELSTNLTFTASTLGPVKILMPRNGVTVTFNATPVGPGPKYVY